MLTAISKVDFSSGVTPDSFEYPHNNRFIVILIWFINMSGPIKTSSRGEKRR